jgi:hypothetical protein
MGRISRIEQVSLSNSGITKSIGRTFGPPAVTGDRRG